MPFFFFPLLSEYKFRSKHRKPMVVPITHIPFDFLHIKQNNVAFYGYSREIYCMGIYFIFSSINAYSSVTCMMVTGQIGGSITYLLYTAKKKQMEKVT